MTTTDPEITPLPSIHGVKVVDAGEAQADLDSRDSSAGEEELEEVQADLKRDTIDEEVKEETRGQVKAETTEEWPNGWDRDLDTTLYKQIEEVSKTTTRLMNDPRANEGIRLIHKFTQELAVDLKQKPEGGKFTPDSAAAALYVLHAHERAVAHAFGVDVTNGGQKEAKVVLPAGTTITKDQVMAKGTELRKWKGLISPKLVNRLEQLGVSVKGLPTRFEEILYARPDQKLTLKVSLVQKGERIISPYAQTWGVEGRESQEILEHLQAIEDLRTEIFYRLGLDPTIDHQLAIMSLAADTPGGAIPVQEINKMRERLLEGKDRSKMSAVELDDIENQAIGLAAVNTCEQIGQRILKAAIEKPEEVHLREAQKARIEENIRRLESGETRKEDVEKEIEKLTTEIERDERDISRLENYVGRIKEDGGREEGLLVQAKKEYHETLDAKDTADAEYAALEDDCDLVDLNSRRSQIISQMSNLPTEISTHLGTRQTSQTEIGTRKGTLATKRLELAAATTDPDKTRIQAEIGALEGEVARYEGNYKLAQDQLKDARAELEKLKQEEKKLLADKSTAKAKKEAAERIFGRKEESVKVILAEFRQGLRETGTKEDNAAGRDRRIETKKTKLRAREKTLEALRKQQAGEPKPEDIEEANRMRAIEVLLKTETYNKLVGDVNAEVAAKMADPRTSQEAILEAVFNHTGYQTKDKDGSLVTRYLSEEAKRELLTKGEIVQIIMESQGIRAGDILEEAEALAFYNRMGEGRNLQRQITQLEQDKPADWQEARSGLYNQQRELLKQNQLVLSGNYVKVTRRLSTDVFSAREFTRHCLRYVAEKAESGELEAVAHVLLEARPAEEVYGYEAQVPKTKYGHAEFHPKSSWPRLPERGKPTYKTDRIDYTLFTKDDVCIRVKSKAEKDRVVSFVRMRKDVYLYNILPPTRAEAQAAGIPIKIIDDAYNPGPAGARKAIEDFADREFVIVEKIEQPDFDQTLTTLQRPGPLGEASRLYPAAAAKMVQEMKPKDKGEILKNFNTVDIVGTALTGINSVSVENGELVVVGNDVSDGKQLFADFIKDYREIYKRSCGLRPEDRLPDNQFATMEKDIKYFYETVGQQLLKAIQRKS